MTRIAKELPLAALPQDPSTQPTPATAGEVAQRLYAQYYAPIRRYCRGQLPSLEEAEDAAQSTFLRAFTALRQGVVPQHESAWLYKIAHNVCLSRRLAATRRARVETPRDLALIQDEVGSPVRSHDELIGLDDVLAEMPERLRTAFLMREWQGLSYHEIADELGISHSAVETLIFRARRHLAKALENTTERARAARRALDFGGVLAGLKALLGGGAVAKGAMAAAAVVLAAGGVAGGRAFASSDRPAAGSPAQQLFANALAASPVLDRVTSSVNAASAPSVELAAARQTSVTRPSVLLPAGDDGASSGSSTIAGATPAIPGAGGSPGASKPAPVPSESAGQASLADAKTAASPPSAPVSVTPTTEAVLVPVPSAPVPSAPVPSVPAPVSTPSVATPTVSTPTVQPPTVSTPTVPTPPVPPVSTPTVPSAPPEPKVQAQPAQTPAVPALPAGPSLP